MDGTGTGAFNSSAPACAASGATRCVYLAKKTQPRASPTTSPVLPGTYRQRFPKPHLGTGGSTGWPPAAVGYICPAGGERLFSYRYGCHHTNDVIYIMSLGSWDQRVVPDLFYLLA